MAKVAIIEDDNWLADIYQTRLKLAGYDCVVAYDGESGLKLIKQELPDLVLLDLMLPMLSGEDVLKQMRSSDWGKDIKVIVLTNVSEYEAPEGLKKLNLERYIVKANVTNNELIEIVNHTLKSDGSAKPQPEPSKK